MESFVRHALGVSAAMMLVACSHVEKDQVEVCFERVEWAEPAPSTVDVTDELQVFATGPAGCDMAQNHLSCEVEVQGDQITVYTEQRWRDKFVLRCDSAFVLARAECSTVGLEPGTYTVHYGDQSTSLEVPGSIGAGCL